MDDVLLELADKLKKLPEELEEGLIKATKKAVDEAIGKMYINLKNGSPKDLAEHQLPAKLVSDNDNYYSYVIDWDDTNVNEKTNYPTIFASRPRLSGKRNFSIAPAKWHDLAYIIDSGRVAAFSTTNTKIVAGTNFIKKARRNAKSWTKKRDLYATEELIKIANKLDEE